MKGEGDRGVEGGYEALGGVSLYGNAYFSVNLEPMP